jgi:chromosome transmission fidelity protein 1
MIVRTAFCPPSERPQQSPHLANDWVAVQTLNRRRHELEAEEAKYRERLLRARRREEAMKRIASGRVVKRQVGGLVFENSYKDLNLLKKLTHPNAIHLPDEDLFLPDDLTAQESGDNIGPRVKALMQR